MEYSDLLKLLEEKLVTKGEDNIWSFNLYSDGAGELIYPSGDVLTVIQDEAELEHYVNALIESVSNTSSKKITIDEVVKVLIENAL